MCDYAVLRDLGPLTWRTCRLFAETTSASRPLQVSCVWLAKSRWPKFFHWLHFVIVTQDEPKHNATRAAQLTSLGASQGLCNQLTCLASRGLKRSPERTRRMGSRRVMRAARFGAHRRTPLMQAARVGALNGARAKAASSNATRTLLLAPTQLMP